MRNLGRITVIMVMVCLMIGQSGCTGIFDSTKSEVRIAKKVLKEKYNEDFEIITLGGRGGTLTNDTFTIKCYPVSDPDYIFKTEIQKEGNFYPIVGRDTTIGYESIYYLTQEQYDDAVIGGKVRISLKGK
ncbi:hypothetical protein [Roseburia inulinivorans]|jgi:hypothetical protein|uniref:Uncharacterized protein n=1 Tax=Roseburia inulinivorans TaxID=360807 RepID=A0A3R5ZAG8_9FIRM|nr:hypothetical protein [Roseburia inulinivorans]RGR64580.1 hypothetical protein DWY29_15675 [Roseburia inulinivorans]